MNNLEMRRVAVTHAGAPLVDVADLRLEPGRPLTIVGESGSGKSVLAHAVMGTLAANLSATGTLVIDGNVHDVADRDGRRRLWGRQLALLPQEPALALDPTMRVRGQLAEGVPDFRVRARDTAYRRADEALDQFGLARAANAYPHMLSGGMGQRVAYAAATIGGARILIVDEPSKGLDAVALDRLADLLADHVDSGGLLLTITHDLRLARRIGGDVAVMREASVIEHGPADVVLTSPSHDYTRRLLAAEPSRWTYDWMSSPAHPDSAPLISATEIAKSYGENELFRDLSLEIRRGERWALTGPSGVGKTTLGNALLRLTPVDRGTVRHDAAVAGGRIQKLYQDPALSFPARVRLELALKDVVRRHRVPWERVESLMSEVGLPVEILRRRPDQVSGGELQRLAIVRAMVLPPALIFADEATSRLDLITQERTVDCLMTEVAESGCALLLVTHDRELAAAVTDRGLALGEVGELSEPVGTAVDSDAGRPPPGSLVSRGCQA
jgi:peptide/nickel transport system ATP-binding protein